MTQVAHGDLPADGADAPLQAIVDSAQAFRMIAAAAIRLARLCEGLHFHDGDIIGSVDRE
jgi:hypothetical protein